jgi:hypothetical protein
LTSTLFFPRLITQDDGSSSNTPFVLLLSSWTSWLPLRNSHEAAVDLEVDIFHPLADPKHLCGSGNLRPCVVTAWLIPISDAVAPKLMAIGKIDCNFHQQENYVMNMEPRPWTINTWMVTCTDYPGNRDEGFFWLLSAR